MQTVLADVHIRHLAEGYFPDPVMVVTTNGRPSTIPPGHRAAMEKLLMPSAQLAK